MPRAIDLPSDLRNLAFRDGVELSHARWDSDVQVLINALEAILQKPSKVPSAKTGRARNTPPKASRLWIGLVLFGVLGFLGSGGWYVKQLAVERAALLEVKAAADKAAADKAAADKVAADKAAADKVAADKVATDKVAADRVVADRPIAVPSKQITRPPSNFTGLQGIVWVACHRGHREASIAPLCVIPNSTKRSWA